MISCVRLTQRTGDVLIEYVILLDHIVEYLRGRLVDDQHLPLGIVSLSFVDEGSMTHIAMSGSPYGIDDL